jgi:O-antigen/teichoic acid export membrane protein
MSIYKSIAKNYVANGFGMGINFLNQIAMVPLFISMWGVNKYADWILITAFSSFFTMFNMGLNSASINEFVIKYQQKEYLICIKLAVNTFLYITVIGMIIILLSLVVAYTTGFRKLLQVSVFSEFETSCIFILLLFLVFVKMFNGVYHGIFRATSHTYISIMIENIVKLCEIFVLFLGILCKINIVVILIIYVIPACVSIIYKHIYVQKWIQLKFSFNLLDLPLLESLVKPSLGFVLIPFGYAVSNQGMIFVVNALLGSAILVAFTTTRTMVNFLRSLMNLLGYAVEPEITVAYGKKDIHTISSLYRRSLIITGVQTIFCIVVLIFFGESIYLAWTKHTILFDPFFFYGMLAVLFLSCLWGITSIIPLATNNHVAWSVTFLIAQLIEVGCAYMFLTIYPHIFAIPIVLVLTELFLLCFSIYKIKQLLNIDNI